MLFGVYNVTTSSVYFLPHCETKFYNHAIQQAKLRFCMF